MRARRSGLLAAEALIGERRGRVASAHRRAVNLLLDDGPLVALLPGPAPLHPWAVEVTLAARDLARVVEGEVVSVADRALAIGPLTIALGGLQVVDLRLARRPRAVSVTAAASLARLLPAPPADTGPFEPTVAAALGRFRAGGDVRRLAMLVGVGEGLTPTGDDVLVGVLAGLDVAREASRSAAARRRRLHDALLAGGTRTTRLSAQMLEAAAVGHYAEPLLAVLHLLAAARPPGAALRRAVTALLAVGHRTGADTLRGLVAALEREGRG